MADQTFTEVQPIQQQQTFSDVAPITGAPAPPATDSLSKATGISAGPGLLARKWNEIKAGLTAAQPGGGLTPQPTFTGNAAEAAGMLGSLISQYGTSEGLPAEAKQISNALPEMPAAKFSKASDLFNTVRNAVGDTPVKLTDEMKNTLDQIKEISSVGTKGGSIADKIVSRLTNAENSDLNWNEAREIYSNIGKQTAQGATSNMQRLLTRFRSQLGDTLSDVASGAGVADEHAQSLNLWRQASDQQAKLDAISGWLKKWGTRAAGGAVLGGGYEAAHDLYKTLFGQ